jgi:hypothetical protein
LIELQLEASDRAFDGLQIREHRSFDLSKPLVACGRDRVNAARSLRGMIPRGTYEAALFEPAEQWVNLVGIDGHQVTADRLDALHQAVTVIGLLFDQMEKQNREERLALDGTAKNFVDAP